MKEICISFFWLEMTKVAGKKIKKLKKRNLSSRLCFGLFLCSLEASFLFLFLFLGNTSARLLFVGKEVPRNSLQMVLSIEHMIERVTGAGKIRPRDRRRTKKN
jgi:hypothetical protein